MVVETRYVAGDGILIGAGERWVLVTDPRDDEVIEDLWSVISGARPVDSSPTEQILAIVEKAFEGDPPGLAIVDLSVGAATFVSRGRGHVRVSGADRTLSLDGGDDPLGLTHARRLVGGVVAASRATLRPLAHKIAPSPVADAPQLPSSGPLIDGIPAAILAASAPEGPPAHPRRRATRERMGADPHEDTGSHHDTSEPDPDLIAQVTDPGPPVIETGGNPEPEQPAELDHDGSTVHRPDVVAHLRHGSNATVMAIACPTGHLTPVDSVNCRVCRQPVAPQEPRQVARPMLGGLRLPTGEVVPLDRGVVLGRKPAPLENSTDWPHLVHLPSDHTFVSRMHLHIELDGWQVLARDLDSRGGTMLTMPGRPTERMRAGEAYALEPGTTLDLAEVYEVRFEVGPVVQL